MRLVASGKLGDALVIEEKLTILRTDDRTIALRPTFKLTRYFTLASGIAIACVTIMLALLFRQNALHEVITTAEVHNTVLARSFGNTIWPRFSAYIRSVATDDPDGLRGRNETAEIHEVLKILTHDLPILKVKIYKGLTQITEFWGYYGTYAQEPT
jgi:hypothetical protein